MIDLDEMERLCKDNQPAHPMAVLELISMVRNKEKDDAKKERDLICKMAMELVPLMVKRRENPVMETAVACAKAMLRLAEKQDNE